jgi:hypothetical protein
LENRPELFFIPVLSTFTGHVLTKRALVLAYDTSAMRENSNQMNTQGAGVVKIGPCLQFAAK